MTEKLSDSVMLLKHCKSSLPTMRLVIILRHSERVSFSDLPKELWGDVGITENGYRAAKVLGDSLVDALPFDHLNVYSWGQRRTWETAQAIASGMAERGGLVCSKGGLSWESPISDHQAYDDFIAEGKWQQLIDSWQRGGDVRNSLKSIQSFGPAILEKLLHDETSPPGEGTVISTHDLNVVPIANFLLGRVVDMPDYLEGVVLAEKEDQARVGYGEFSDVIRLGQMMWRK